MKHTIKNGFSAVVLLVAMVFALSSCYETHYYNHNHHHSREWYDRHHTPPPAGVNFDIDIHR